MRDFVTTIAEIAGGVSITVGVSQVSSAAGWVVGGVLLIVFSVRAA